MNHSVFESFESDSTKKVKVVIELKGKERMEVFYIPPEKAKKIAKKIYDLSNQFVLIEDEDNAKVVLIRIDEIRLIEFDL